MQIWLNTFAHDTKVHIALLLVAADFVFGVLAAIKTGKFRLSYVSDFLRNDVLFKLVPYFALYSMALTAGNATIGLPIDFGDLAGIAYVAVVAAWAASILSSLNTLGFEKGGAQSLKTALLGAENTAPPKS